jgi:hypothetical protein
MQRYVVPVMLCLTLGLAPFRPEPHLVGKLRWVAGGAVGMSPLDWGDLLMHGAPFVLLLGVAVHHAWTLRDAGDAPG